VHQQGTSTLLLSGDAQNPGALVYFLETPVWVGGSLAITAVAVVDRLELGEDGDDECAQQSAMPG
jgi:hypothetical protein